MCARRPRREAQVFDSRCAPASYRVFAHRLAAATDGLAHTLARLRALSPAATLERGYAIVQRADGHVARAAQRRAKGDTLRIRLAQGELSADGGGRQTHDR